MCLDPLILLIYKHDCISHRYILILYGNQMSIQYFCINEARLRPIFKGFFTIKCIIRGIDLYLMQTA